MSTTSKNDMTSNHPQIRVFIGPSVTFTCDFSPRPFFSEELWGIRRGYRYAGVLRYLSSSDRNSYLNYTLHRKVEHDSIFRWDYKIPGVVDCCGIRRPYYDYYSHSGYPALSFAAGHLAVPRSELLKFSCLRDIDLGVRWILVDRR